MAMGKTATDRPLVVIVAGPNGAGKSTTAPELLSQALHVQEFVNADAIALGLSGLQPDTVAFAAGRVMLARLKVLAGLRADFAFETTLASRTFAPWLNKLRESGYRAHLIFLSLPNVDLALERVAERVRLGGHNVPPDVVRRRFVGGLRNFFSLYRPRVDSWQLIDNSKMDAPSVIASRLPGQAFGIENQAAWTNLLEKIR
jgi:predicted ABC-type ATPase